MTTITKEAAQRIARAARRLPDIDAREFTLWIARRLDLPITEDKLSTLTVTDLKGALTAEESVESLVETEVDMAALKDAVRILWGEPAAGDDAPQPEPYAEGDMPGSLRVAVASNTGENLDGHFGTALRFLIYQVDRATIRLIDVRPTAECDLAEDKNAARAALIADCQIAYVQSIGGPAAAKVVRAGVHPLKIPTAGPARATIARLQSIIDAPPPWLAKIMGVEARSLSRFAEGGEEAA
ncbi:MAG: dinitrogenase iron-molybdenum cofactor N-terminal domain-containing protein [Burkholderiales bacterium]|nr:dinitrogenase iron-molybdenum cofactor N-terminal domain-containing protein [Burkholderiales bacterium]